MPTPQRASVQIISELLSDLSRAYHCGIDEFKRAKLKRDICNSKITQYHIDGLLGVYYTVVNKPKKMREHFNNAIRLAPGDSQLFLNYVRSLTNASMLDEARKLAITCNEKFWGEMEFLNLCIVTSSRLGEFQKAIQFANEYKMLCKKDSQDANNIEIYSEIITQEYEADYKKLVDSAYKQIVQEEGFQIKRTQLSVIQDDSTPSILYKMYISASPERAAEITLKLTDSPVIYEVDTEVLMRSAFQVLPHKVDVDSWL